MPENRHFRPKSGKKRAAGAAEKKSRFGQVFLHFTMMLLSHTYTATAPQHHNVDATVYRGWCAAIHAKAKRAKGEAARAVERCKKRFSASEMTLKLGKKLFCSLSIPFAAPPLLAPPSREGSRTSHAMPSFVCCGIMFLAARSVRVRAARKNVLCLRSAAEGRCMRRNSGLVGPKK